MTQLIHCPFQPKQSPSSKIRIFQLSTSAPKDSLWNQLPSDSGGCIAQAVPEQTRLPHAALNHYIGPCFITMHCFLPVFTNVFYFYTNFISSTPLFRLFYSWCKHKRIRTVGLRHYSRSLAHPRGMYSNGKEGRKDSHIVRVLQ